MSRYDDSVEWCEEQGFVIRQPKYVVVKRERQIEWVMWVIWVIWVLLIGGSLLAIKVWA